MIGSMTPPDWCNDEQSVGDVANRIVHAKAESKPHAPSVQENASHVQAEEDDN